MSNRPRGIRLNNPGNIERGANWQGLAQPHEMTPEQKAEKRFAVFRSPEWGIRAIVRILQTYRRRYGLDTVRGIVSRWAPPVENDTGSYIEHVAEQIGAGPDDPLDTTDPAILVPLVKAIIEHENGEQPYSDETIRAGIALADLPAPEPKPITKSKRVTGAAVIAGVTTAVTQSREVISAAKEIVATVSPQVAESGNWIGVAAIVGTALVAFAMWVGWTVWQDYRNRAEPEEVV